MIQRIPSDSERAAVHFERHLIGSSTDAAALHLDARLRVLDRTSEDFERIDGVGAFVSAIDRGVNDTLREGTFSVLHDLTNETANNGLSNFGSRFSGLV